MRNAGDCPSSRRRKSSKSACSSRSSGECNLPLLSKQLREPPFPPFVMHPRGSDGYAERSRRLFDGHAVIEDQLERFALSFADPLQRANQAFALPGVLIRLHLVVRT